MTTYYTEKAEIGQPLAPAPPNVMMQEPTVQPWTCQYVFSVFTAFFCTCMPCSVIGLVHFLSARNSHAVGHNILAEKKKSQANCWTGWGFALGLILLITYIVLYALYAESLMRQYRNQNRNAYYSG